MFVIMGASGQVGGAALDHLVSQGRRVRAISRRPQPARQNVEWVTADALDTSALAAAFKGAEAAFVLNAAPIDAADVYAEADKLSRSIASALTLAAVPHVVALSSQGAHLHSGTGIVRTLHRFEAELRKVPGTRFTFLRPAYFMETWLPLAQAAAATGEMPSFFTPASRRIDTVSGRDVGRIAAEQLLDPQPGIVNIAGPARFGDEDAAGILSELTKRPVALSPVPASAVAGAHEAVGLGASYAAGIAALYEALNRDGLPFEPQHRQVTGTATLREVLASAVS